jgi:predicted transposase YbfD/YdcC
MGCQKKIVKKIADKEGNYLLAVEGNQPNLFKAFDNHFRLEKFSRYSGISFTTEEKGHGSTETRMHLVCDIFEEFVDLSLEWSVMKSLGIAISHRVEGTEERQLVFGIILARRHFRWNSLPTK